VKKEQLLLNSATIDGDGRLKRQPTLKNLNREYEFMPKFGKQVGGDIQSKQENLPDDSCT